MRFVFCALFAAIGFNSVYADSIGPNDPIIYVDLKAPKGLKEGDKFRFIYVTANKTDARSSDISTYDNFVNQEAFGTTYNGSVVHWVSVASTSTVNAIDHINQSPIVGVYEVDGTKIAASTTNSLGGLWSGLLFNSPMEGVTGNQQQPQFVWTGTNVSGDVVNGLGTITAEVGHVTSKDGGWVDANIAKPVSDQYVMYGISDVLMVSAVPEPTSLLLSSIGLIAIFALKKFI